MKHIDELAKYTKFVIGGGIGLLINIAITYLLTDIFSLWFRIAYAIGLGVNVGFNFFYHMHFTFKKKDRAVKRLYKFIPLTLSITAINYVLVLIFTELITINLPILDQYYKYIVIILITGFVSVLNYFSNKVWVFE